MDPQTLLPIGFVLLIVTMVTVTTVSVLRSRKSATALSTTARARGWTYQADGQAQIDVGEIFDEPNQGAYRNVIQGNADETSFVAFDYWPPSNGGPHGFVLVNLPKFLPVLEVRPAGSIQRAARGREYGLPLVRFESADFNARFSVQSPDAKFASDLINPRLMQALLAAPPLKWRLMDGCLVSWSDSRLTALQIVSTLPTLRLILDSIPEFVWDTYASAQPVAFGSEPVPAGQGAGVQTAPAPAGWYPDPNDPTMARWWNGNAWTSNRAKVQAR